MTASMLDADSNERTSGSKPIALSLPDIPAERPFLHDAIRIMEAINNGLSELKLLDVAHGGQSPSCELLVDFPVESF